MPAFGGVEQAASKPPHWFSTMHMRQAAVDGQFRVIAERGHFDADLSDQLEEIFLAVYFNGHPVYRHTSLVFHNLLMPP